MKLQYVWYYLVLTGIIFIFCINPSLAQTRASLNLTVDHQDPAGDVLKFNETLNGTPIDEPLFEMLDIKWIYSEKDMMGNLVLKMDLKAKNKFINEEQTKYVFRILTAFDNTTGYNITYHNQTMFLVPFFSSGNGTPINIFDNVTFIRDKGDELMQVTISIAKYLNNISHFNLDAYSMKVTDNATYLDYISELPGHPEYVNPEVQEGENLDTNVADNDNESDGSVTPGSLWLVVLVIIIVLVLVVILVWFSRKRRNRKINV